MSEIVVLEVQDLNISIKNPVGELFKNCSCEMVVIEVQTLDVGQQGEDLTCEEIIAEVYCWDIDLNLGHNGSIERVSLQSKRCEWETEQDARDTATELIQAQIKITKTL